jgi:uncharacterized protein (TIGR03067 family)
VPQPWNVRHFPNTFLIGASKTKVKLIFKELPGLTALLLFLPCVLTNAPAADTTNQQAAVELQRLQGAWEGVLLGQESAGKVSITITTNSLRFQGRDKHDWYVAKFTLLTETNPQQLHTTITGAHQTNHIGSVVRAIFKIEGETLSLAGIQDNDQEPPKTFSEPKPAVKSPNGPLDLSGSALGGLVTAKPFEDDTVFRYKLQKLPPQLPAK